MKERKTISLTIVSWLMIVISLLGIGGLAGLYIYFHHQLISSQNALLVAAVWLVLVTLTLLVLRNRLQRSYQKLNQLLADQNIKYQQAVIQAQRIEKGDYKVASDLASENNPVIDALSKVSWTIQNKAKLEEENNWIITGIAEVGELLRTNSELHKLGETLTKCITQKTNSVQAAFYVVNEHNTLPPTIDLVSCYAYNRKKYMYNSFQFGEGLIGQAAVEADVVYRTEIPDNYTTLTSGLIGDKKPKAIFILPLIANEKVFGVIEIAALEPYTARVRKFLSETSKIIAQAIFNIKVNEDTLKMLAESQQMSEELGEQRQQLMENAKDMALAQEELEKTNIQLQQKITEVNNAQKRQHALLERASEIISIYEPDGTVRYESPSIKNILGYDPAEFQGKNERSKMHPDDVDKFDLNFAHILKNPTNSITFQFRYLKQDGSLVWIESTLTNLLNDPAINGIIMNSRDITMQKLAEREQRMRGQMQALSENSPDLITRLGLDNKVYYINPTIETFTNQPAPEFINHFVNETSIPAELKNVFNQIITEVSDSKSKFQSEIEIPLNEGKRIFQVKGIPEFNEQGGLETTLVISTDITEQKNAEREIKDINTKILDSINYARRIQKAIIPNDDLMGSILGEYLMYYKPKDVVSGDFPWIYVNGDYTYIAAVDCTGHGVPGAMMSLIGFLLLNDLANDTTPKTPAQILNGLHQRLVATLKQNMPGSNSSDGMDLAICRINNRNNEVIFSGAHRPLYLIRNKVFEELKGDKFPIGGIQYEKKRVPFIDYELQLNKGDSFFMFSDGLPDQLGGPEKRKFMSTRVQGIITENTELSMPEMKVKFETEIESWMNGHKQIDDILLIGKRF
ncbi:MAG: PAS domain S-box protein [Bacteroidota bacterium]|nr:PAS domain S-box protein [Bacteroidota bacterium]